MSSVLSTDKIMEERFIAFIDILGFKEIIKRIESDNESGNSDLKKLNQS